MVILITNYQYILYTLFFIEKSYEFQALIRKYTLFELLKI